MCEQCERREEADRLMWLAIARALVTVQRGLAGVSNAIVRRYGDGRQERAA